MVSPVLSGTHQRHSNNTGPTGVAGHGPGPATRKPTKASKKKSVAQRAGSDTFHRSGKVRQRPKALTHLLKSSHRQHSLLSTAPTGPCGQQEVLLFQGLFVLWGLRTSPRLTWNGIVSLSLTINKTKTYIPTPPPGSVAIVYPRHPPQTL